MKFRNDPEGVRLPVKLDCATNGEFTPTPLPRHLEHMNRIALERADEHARRLRVGRREFLVSLSGAATCLLAMNDVNAALGKTGGRFLVPREAAQQSGYSLIHTDLRQRLKYLHMPVVAIHGGKDTVVNPHELDYFKNGHLPHGRAMLFERSQHFPMLDAPADFHKTLLELLEQ